MDEWSGGNPEGGMNSNFFNNCAYRTVSQHIRLTSDHLTNRFLFCFVIRSVCMCVCVALACKRRCSTVLTLYVFSAVDYC